MENLNDEREIKELGIIGLDSDGDPIIREPVRVTLSEFKRTKFLDIRKVYNRDGEWLPTNKGITLTEDTFEAVLGILNKQKDEIKEWIKHEKK